MGWITLHAEDSDEGAMPGRRGTAFQEKTGYNSSSPPGVGSTAMGLIDQHCIGVPPIWLKYTHPHCSSTLQLPASSPSMGCMTHYPVCCATSGRRKIPGIAMRGTAPRAAWQTIPPTVRTGSVPSWVGASCRAWWCWIGSRPLSGRQPSAITSSTRAVLAVPSSTLRLAAGPARPAKGSVHRLSIARVSAWHCAA